MKARIFLTILMLTVMSAATVSAQDQKGHSVEVIRYTIPADQHGSFEEAYKEAGKYLLASPYCLGYQVLHGEEEPDHYIVIIDWTSTQEHLNGFRQSAQFRPFFNLVKPFYNELQEMKHYHENFVSAKK
jgi:quinol monooxygenase YgiN